MSVQYPEQVVQVGFGEEYFAEDYSRVHCKHGAYIGYPGGADYICGACEDGFDTLHQGTKFILAYRIWYGEEKLWGLWNEVDTVYSEEGKSRFQPFLDLFIGSDLEMESRVTEETFSYWGPEEENAD